MLRRRIISARIAAAVMAAALSAATVTSFTPVAPVGASGRLTARTDVRTSSTGVGAWGDNSAGELGDATLTPSTTRVPVSGLQGVEAIAARGRHDLALLRNGSVEAWGDDTFGQLGDGTEGTNDSSEVPVAVDGLSGVTAIAAGTEHSLALLADGTVMAWGDNAEGQLGDGTTKESDVPVAVTGLTGVTAIAAGQLFSMARLSDGTVMTWGSNSDGQLGDGSFTDSDVPLEVGGLTGVKAIAGGDYHALALLGDGGIEAWGQNIDDQLGDGNDAPSDSPTPVSVVKITTAVAVAAGSEHSAALLSDGKVMVWGDNGFFQLARPNGYPGGVGQSGVPLAVKGIPVVSAIAAGGLFTLAVTTAGKVVGWGDDAFGQLGNGSTITDDAPATVKGLSGVTAIAAGGVSSLAVSGVSASAAGPGGLPSSIWQVEPTVDPGPPSDVVDFFFNGVSAVTTDDAWAVGNNGLGMSLPLSEHWNGSSWKVAKVPLPAGAAEGALQGVDELSPTDAWAVGTKTSTQTGGELTLIEHWDGTRWKVVHSPNPATGPDTSDELEAIAGAAPNDLWAVGSFNNGVVGAVLLEHWNGKVWTVVASPENGSFFFATSVTAISASDVWVVGDTATATFSINWNGSSWTPVPTPILNDGNAPLNQLTGVSGSRPDDVWASGYENVTSENLKVPYLLHWTRSSWTLVKTPDPGTEGSLLTGVTDPSPSDVWAVGITDQTDGAPLSLSEHFNGTSWSVSPSLDPGQLEATPDSSFDAITSVDGALFAVGAQEQPGRCCLLTLAEGAEG